MKKAGKLIIEGHDKNPFVKFWNWGWGIYYKNPEIWNYLIVGLLTTIVSLAVKWIMYATICDPEIDTYFNQQLPVDVSWVIAVLFAYVTNRKFVFQSKNKNIFKEFSSFVGSRILTFLMEKGLTWLLLTILNINAYVVTIINQVLITIFNYVFSKLFVFKKED